MPAMQPPPPTGTITVGSPPSCSSISAATVPWPAMVRGSSNGGTRVAPVRAHVVERGRRRRRRRCRRGDEFDDLAAVRADPVALLPRGVGGQVDPAVDSIDRQANAKPCAWLPAASTPRRRRSRPRSAGSSGCRRHAACRTGPTCRSSRLRNTLAPVACESRSVSCSGLRATKPEIR